MKRLALIPLLLMPLFAQKAAPPADPVKALKFPPLRDVVIPKPEVFRLPNGMKIYLLEDHELPMVRGVALVRTGGLYDPAGKTGLASMAGTVLRSGGTKAKTGDQIDEQLENMAASVESSVSDAMGSVSFSCLKENTGDVLKVFHDLMMQPEFRQDKIDLTKKQFRSSIARRNDSPGGIAGREFTNTIYGKDTPYGRDVEYANVDAIERADLVNFHQRYYFPANTMLAVYGDFLAGEMRVKLRELFADWVAEQQPVPPLPAVTRNAAPGIYFAEKEDTTQTFFHVGLLGTTLRDKDYAALNVMADILGGGFSSRLLNHIRTQLGYAYDISAHWGAEYAFPGLFTISGGTKSASTVETLQAIREDIEKIRTVPVTASELQTSKDKVLNSFVFNFDRPSKTLNRILMYDYYGYPADFIFQYQKAVRETTAVDILRVAQQHIDPAKLTFVAVGNSKEFGTPLTSMNMPVHKIDLTIPEPKAATPAAKVDAGTLQKGKELLQRAQQAAGGVEKLAAVKDVTQTVEMAMGAMGGMKIKQFNRKIGTSHFRQDMEAPFGKQSVYFDGKAGWIVSPQGAMPMPPPVVGQVKSSLFREWFSLLLSDRNPERTVNYVGDSTVEISDKSGNSVKVKFDEATGLPASESYTQRGMGGVQQVEEKLSDFRDVSGVKMPFKIQILQGGQPYSQGVLQEAKINTGLTAEELGKKP